VKTNFSLSDDGIPTVSFGGTAISDQVKLIKRKNIITF